MSAASDADQQAQLGEPTNPVLPPGPPQHEQQPMPLVASRRARVYWCIGLLWVALTLAFEFLFGHYVAGKSWSEVCQVFNVARGNLFLVALIVAGLAPWLAARARRLV